MTKLRLLAATAALASAFAAAPSLATAAAEVTRTVKKKFVYRSHTQIDLTGQTVQGKTRAPEVFYVFQRKRSESHHVVHTPSSFDYHRGLAEDTLRRALPK
jgi:hypothetical protein